MHRLWFVTNVRSGTATHDKCEAIEAVFEERGLELGGRTRFPDDDLPTPEELAAARIDTLVLFAGDGTINAALCQLSDWTGAFLILPGGTMNLLAKALHDSLDPHAIIAAAHHGGGRAALPFMEAGPYRAFVGLIVGPGATWVRPREAVRHHRIGRAARAVRLAWRRTFGRGVRIEGVPRFRRRYQAIFVRPEIDHLYVAGVDARDWRSIVELGWSAVTGDWMAARAVDTASASRLRIAELQPVLALFDGEPQMIESGTIITPGRSREVFVTTKADR